MRPIVSDTTALIVLGKLNRYDLLENLFERIYIPQAIMSEIDVKSDGVREAIEAHALFETKSINDNGFLALFDGILDEGESQAIVLAKEMDMLLLIDEKKAEATPRVSDWSSSD